jgi:hypothetical protein
MKVVSHWVRRHLHQKAPFKLSILYLLFLFFVFFCMNESCFTLGTPAPPPKGPLVAFHTVFILFYFCNGTSCWFTLRERVCTDMAPSWKNWCISALTKSPSVYRDLHFKKKKKMVYFSADQVPLYI